ncbi:MAG: helix-turn-helix domain-containing protein [Planctomycetes bacterium]|nr:helix-turn-helix domain-containing protein [Planctomycetota bacterium]
MILPSSHRQKISPAEVARRWGIKPTKVLTWIRAGELRAIDAATVRGGRPRFLIDLEDLAAFEAARAVTPPAAPTTRRRRLATKEYF